MDSSGDDEFDVERTPDGALIAGGWHGFSCDNCGSYHIELLDNNSDVFAIMVIESEHLLYVGTALLELAAKQAKGNRYNGH